MDNQSQSVSVNCLTNFVNSDNDSQTWVSKSEDPLGPVLCPTPTYSTGTDLNLSIATVTIGVLLILIILASIIGNLLVCIAIYTDRRLRKLGNLFLASLAVADLLVACLVMTVSLVNDFTGYWIFSIELCDIWISFDVMCCTASILNLCAISLDRFIHIKDPFRYSQWMTKKTIVASVVFVWLISGLISFVPITLGWHKPDTSPALINGQDLDVTQASVDSGNTDNQRFICSLDLTPTYAVLSSLISFYLPCVIMLALYARLYVYARKHVKNIQVLTKPLHNPTQAPVLDSNNHHNNGHHTNEPVMTHHPRSGSNNQNHVTDHKAAITVGVIMGVFLFCWVPFFCLNVVAGFCKTCVPDKVFKIITYLGWFNSSMNPVIYSIFNTEFRDAFRRIIVSYTKDRCYSCCTNSSSSSLSSSSAPVSNPHSSCLRTFFYHACCCGLCSRCRCCPDNADERRRNSSKSEPFCGGQNRNLMNKAVHSSLKGNNHQGITGLVMVSGCGGAQKPVGRCSSSSAQGYLEVIPARQKFEIICQMDGKISAL